MLSRDWQEAVTWSAPKSLPALLDRLEQACGVSPREPNRTQSAVAPPEQALEASHFLPTHLGTLSNGHHPPKQ